MEFNLSDLVINEQEIAYDENIARTSYLHYERERWNWSMEERRHYAVCKLRWAKRVRDKLESVIDYWIKQRGIVHDDEFEEALEQAHVAESIREKKWGYVVSYWRTQYEANKSK